MKQSEHGGEESIGRPLIASRISPGCTFARSPGDAAPLRRRDHPFRTVRPEDAVFDLRPGRADVDVRNRQAQQATTTIS